MERLRILLNQMVSEKTADVFQNEIRNRPPALLVKLVQERESLNSLLNQIGISPGLDRVGVITALEIWSKEYVKKEQGPLAIEKEEKQRSMAIIEKEEEQGPLAIEKEEEQGSMAIIEKEEEKSLDTDEKNVTYLEQLEKALENLKREERNKLISYLENNNFTKDMIASADKDGTLLVLVQNTGISDYVMQTAATAGLRRLLSQTEKGYKRQLSLPQEEVWKYPRANAGTFTTSSREEFKKAFKAEEIVDLSNLNLGPTPKHFPSGGQLLMTEQIKELTTEVLKMNDTARTNPYGEERIIVLCGPMGVGKSCILWSIAAKAFSEQRRLLYISDASKWMVQPENNQLSYLINVFISLNRDILSIEELQLLEKYDYGYFLSLLEQTPCIILIDEHTYVVQNYEEKKATHNLQHYLWLTPFMIMNSISQSTTLVLGASSHGKFELRYLKNGMEKFKRFVSPVTSNEANKMLVLFKCPPLNERLVSLILYSCNNVPREILNFTKFAQTTEEVTEKTIDLFQILRKDSFQNEASNYYENLSNANKVYFLNTLSSMFRKGSLNLSGVSDATGFVDLGLCYRDDSLRVYPLCIAASRALLEIYFQEFPKQEKYKLLIDEMKNNTIRGDDFEELVWHFITRNALSSTGLNATAYYLNGKQELINLKFDNYYVASGHDDIPKSLQNHNVLFRMINDYPRYDFISIDAFIQISKSKFTDHNKDSAKIELSFHGNCNSQVALALKKLTGKNHVTKIENGQLIITKAQKKVAQTKIIYITLDPPYHPNVYNKFKNLLVISAKDFIISSE